MELTQIITALNKAYAECGEVKKKGKNEKQNYKYASEEQFIEATRSALQDNKIIIFPVKIEFIKDERYQTNSGASMRSVLALYKYRFQHVSGEFIEVMALGEGMDAGDKASYKAATGAFKYAIKQSLMLATGDDAEKDSPNVNGVNMQPVPPVAKKSTGATKQCLSCPNTFIADTEWKKQCLDCYKSKKPLPQTNTAPPFPEEDIKIDEIPF